jgi:hypothetical protein
VASLNLNDTALLAQLDPALEQPLLAGFAEAMDVAFLICGIILAAGFVFGFWFKDVPLSRKAGTQRRAEAADGGDGKGTVSVPAARLAGARDGHTADGGAEAPVANADD